MLQDKMFLGRNELNKMTVSSTFAQYFKQLYINNLIFIIMKKITYLLVLMVMTVMPVQLHAQNVFYVSPTGDDTNPGTQAAPWSSPNATKWTDGCTVKISGEIYAFERADVKAKSVTLEGITSDAAIAALADDEFADKANISGFQLFNIGDDTNAATLTIKNLTIKNVRRADLNASGGMIFVDILGTLNIENSVFKNFESTIQSFGGVVQCVGKIHAKNTTFDNNSCMYGGAVQIQESEEPVEGTFENCVFTNNKADIYLGADGISLTTYSQGGAVSMQAIKRGNFIFDKCYFKSNQSKKNLGGAMLLSLVNNVDINVSLKITNSTFNDNYTFKSGAAIAFKGNPASGKLDFTIANCTFYKNTAGGLGTGIAVSTVDMGGPNSKPEVTGTHIFANNTFFRNTKDAQSAYSATFLYGQRGSDLVLVNNVFLEETWSGSQGITVEPGIQGEVGSKTPVFNYKSYTAKNNIFGRLGGSYVQDWPVALRTEVETKLENNNRVLSDSKNNLGWQVSPEEKAVILGLDTLLAKTSVPYLPIINKDGLAVDFGTSSLLIGGTNIVPQTDVIGSGIYGAFRDAGAYEFSGATGIQTISQKSVYIYPTLFSNDLYLSENTASVKLYNISGVCCLTASNVSRVNSSGLASGLYIVKITDKAGKVFIEKAQKQ
jgi:hypothetical protein